LLAAIIASIGTGVMKRDHCVVDRHSGTGYVVVSRRHIVSEVDNVPSSWTRRNSSIIISEVRDVIPCTSIQ